jgi:hypothetical protein
MPQSVSEVVSGPATIYIAPVTVAVPTLSGNPAADFAAFDTPGYTDDGVECDYTPTDKEIHVDEESFPVDVLIDKEASGITVKLAQSSMQNLYYAMSGATLNAGGDIITFGGLVRPNLFRLAVAGPSPSTNKLREMLWFRVYAKSALKIHYKRNDKQMYQVSFMALADSTQPVAGRAGIFQDF